MSKNEDENELNGNIKNKQITEMAEKLKGAVEEHQKKKEMEKKEKAEKENTLCCFSSTRRRYRNYYV